MRSRAPCVRLFVTRRHLLEWVPAAQATIGPRLDLLGFYRLMAGGVAVGVLAVPVSPAVRARHVASGGAARRAVDRLAGDRALGQPVARGRRPDPRIGRRRPGPAADRPAHLAVLRNFRDGGKTTCCRRTISRRTQHPRWPTGPRRPISASICCRWRPRATSPGWEPPKRPSGWRRRWPPWAASRGFRGHFYNWYDTDDLRPLDPQYVSTVDSGNLAGHLITLANACREWAVVAPAPAQRLAGIADALDLARDATDQLREGRRTQTVTWHQLDETLTVLAAGVRGAAVDGESIADRSTDLAVQAETVADIAAALASERGDDTGADMLFWIDAARRAIESHRRDIDQSPTAAAALAARLASLETTARTTALEMGYGFLLDPDRKLLSIGYRVADGTLDPSCYDLLASEARLASFIAIAKGDVPARHWFHLGRAVTPIAHGAALISWSGSMFEYLMPSLVMRAPAGSLLEQTSRLIVRRQIEYGDALGLPWGVSESAYNARDLEFTYQYSNFGVPGLGLKRGLGENAVVAPYATALATMVDPGGRGTQLRAAGQRRRVRPLWVLRGAGLYGEPAAGGCARRDRARLHGPPSGHDDRGDRRRVAGWRDAGPFPCRADGPGDRTAAAGGHATRRRRGASLGRGRNVGRQDAGDRTARRQAADHRAHRFAGHPSAVQRRLRGDADRRRLRLQPVAGFGRDALARGRHLRRLGFLRLPARRAQREGLVGGLPAERCRARRLRRRVQRGSRRVHPARRRAHDHAGGARLGRRRCRGQARLDREFRQPGARDRRDLLCRARAGGARKTTLRTRPS